MKILKKILLLFKAYRLVGFKIFFLKKNRIRVSKNVKLHLHKSVSIEGCSLNLLEGAELYIGENVLIKNVNINISGKLVIQENSFVNNGYMQRNSSITINSGEVVIGSYNRIQCNILVRYGGILKIGNRNNINSESEIRCDDNIVIGDYNQISYRVMIWDTNTHNIYSASKRREMTDSYFPIFGHEIEKPKTKKVLIGNDCWISKDVTILKGSEVGDKCILGYGTLLSNTIIPSSNSVINDTKIKIFKNNL
ncbi:acyltransferase [Hyunsoonleella sp. 2307UL5-6]|uniref:acyltransferase n=1 Tax=Hyunsoonleella sp. 2307UL5-6 TaxID=3384768 RepID=UPI0039BD7E04